MIDWTQQCGFCRHDKIIHGDTGGRGWCNGYNDDGDRGSHCRCDGFALSMHDDPYSANRGLNHRTAVTEARLNAIPAHVWRRRAEQAEARVVELEQWMLDQ